jgi:uncharacterized membrane protein
MEFAMRDLIKTATFAVLHFGVGFGVTFALTGSVAIATGVALIEPTVNTLVFYFHEKGWNVFWPASAAEKAVQAAAPESARAHNHGFSHIAFSPR